MQAYLDNSATTKCAPEVVDVCVKVMQEDYGNPSSKHMKGVEAEKYIKDAKEIIAKTLKCQEKEILFTSGGTESNNMAVIGTAMANKRKGNHVIVSLVEHSSVKEPFNFLEEQGFRVTYLKVDSKGVVDLEELKRELDDETILVSVMYTNNEIGTVEPIEEIGHIKELKNEEDIRNTVLKECDQRIASLNDSNNSRIEALTDTYQKKLAACQAKIDEQAAVINSITSQYNELMDIACKYRDEALRWRSKFM